MPTESRPPTVYCGLCGRKFELLDYASMSVTLLIAIIYVLSNQRVDVLYAYLDPRIMYG